jgi:hypothetical protein
MSLVTEKRGIPVFNLLCSESKLWALPRKYFVQTANGSSPPDGQESYFKEGQPVLFFWTNKGHR